MSPLLLTATAVWAAISLLLLRLAILERPRKESPAASPHRPGLWLMAHRADKGYPFQHSFYKITPSRAVLERHPELFLNRDDAGAPYATLGAGPWEGKLKLEFNRLKDLTDDVSYEERLQAAEENVEALIAAAGRYRGEERFSTLAGPGFKGYNCSAIMATLAARSGIRLPSSARVYLRFHGYSARVPDSAFAPEPRPGS